MKKKAAGQPDREKWIDAEIEKLRAPSEGARGRGKPPKTPLQAYQDVARARAIKTQIEHLKRLAKSRGERAVGARKAVLEFLSDKWSRSVSTIEDMLTPARRRKRRKP